MPGPTVTGNQAQVNRRKARRKKDKPDTPKVPRARRTPTEIGQTVPQTQKGQRQKAKALKAAKKGKRPSKVYRKVQAAEAKKAAFENVQRYTDRQRDTYTPAKVRRAAQEGEGSSTAGPIGLSGIAARETAEAADVTLRTAGEIATTAIPIPTLKGAQAALKAGKVAKFINTADDAAKARALVKEAKVARQAARASAREGKGVAGKAGATAKGMSKQARARLSKIEAKAAAKRTRQRAADRAVGALVPVKTTAVAASPSDVGEQVREVLKAHAEANPIKTAETTYKAVPGLFSYAATTGAGAVKAATGGGTGSLESAGKQGLDALKALEVLGSGDSAEIAEAMETELGYPFAPLVAKGTFSKPAAALAKGAGKGAAKVGRGVGKGTRKVARPVATGAARAADVGRKGGKYGENVKGKPRGKHEARLEQRRATIKTKAGVLRRAGQIVAGTGRRKTMKTIADRTKGQGQREAAHAVRKTFKESKGLYNKWGADAENLSVVLHEHGVTPETPLVQLQAVLDDFKRRGVDTSDATPEVNQRSVIEWAMENPEVFNDPNLWKTKDLHGELAREVRRSGSAHAVSQGRVAGVVERQERVPKATHEIMERGTGKGKPQKYEQGGAEHRGKKIGPDETPETMYHVTTAGGRVEGGKLKGTPDRGGLGSHDRKNYVSLTSSKRGAEELADDMRLVAEISRKHGSKEMLEEGGKYPGRGDSYFSEGVLDDLKARAKKEGWDYQPGKNSQIKVENGRIWAFDVLSDFFLGRAKAGGRPDPYFAGFDVAAWQKLHPDLIEIMPVSRQQVHASGGDVVPQGGKAGNLDEVRVYGEIPIEGGAPKRWTRQQAWDRHDFLRDSAAEMKSKAKALRLAAKKSPPAKRPQMLRQARLFERGAKRRVADAKELNATLDPFTRPGQSLDGKRLAWDKDMETEFLEDVARMRDPAAGEGGLVSDKINDRVIGEQMGDEFGKTPAAAKIKSGETAAADLADRGFMNFAARTVSVPRVARGLNKFITEVVREFKQPIPGRKGYVLKGVDEYNELVKDGLIDPRKIRPVPVRFIQQGVKNADIEGYGNEVSNALSRELDTANLEPGSKYVLMRNEDAIEFLHQLNPKLDAGLASHLGTVASRLILGTNPAWLEAQYINELTQAGVAVNPYRLLKGRHDLRKWAKQNPELARRFNAAAGDNPTVLHSLTPDELFNEADPAGAYEFSRRTPVGGMLRDLATARTLAKIDQRKGAWIRSAALAGSISRELDSLPAKAKREVNHFFKGLAGMQDTEYRLLKEVSKMDQAQRADFLATPKGQKYLEKHLDYLDDVMGNWQAFTRFERKYAPALIFYPYVRMSLRWTFAMYPKRHPVKAQMLYLLAQQNNQELEKLLGRPPSFLEAANPVVWGDEGEVESVLPGGRRFGAPGSNALVEAIGTGNLEGITRAANPFVGSAVEAVTGVDAFTGEKEQFEGNVGQQLVARSLGVGEDLLGLSAPVRMAFEEGERRLGWDEPGPASEEFDALDPDKKLRSLAVPFLPQSAESFKKQSDLSKGLSSAGKGPSSEIGQLAEMLEVYGEDKTKDILKEQAVGKEFLSAELPDFPENPELDRIIEFYNKLKGEALADEGEEDEDEWGGYGKPQTPADAGERKKWGYSKQPATSGGSKWGGY